MRRLRPVDDHAGKRQAAAAQGFDRQERVIDGAERRAGDEDHREMQLGREVDDIGRVGEGHEHAARAFDHQQAVRRRRLELRHVDGDACAPRRLVRRHRLGQHIGLGQDAVRGDFGEPAHGRGVGLWLGPGLHRLPIDAASRWVSSQAETTRLADIGIGACDEKALQSG